MFVIRPGSVYWEDRGLADLTDVTLADEDTKSILTDNNGAFQGNVAMKVTHSGGQLWNQCKIHHPLTKFWTNFQQIRKCIF